MATTPYPQLSGVPVADVEPEYNDAGTLPLTFRLILVDANGDPYDAETEGYTFELAAGRSSSVYAEETGSPTVGTTDFSLSASVNTAAKSAVYYQVRAVKSGSPTSVWVQGRWDAKQVLADGTPGSDTAPRIDVQVTVTSGSPISASGYLVRGAEGTDGTNATVSVGTVSTLSAGSDATVTNSGTSSAAVLDFGIPAGADGADGTDGTDGEDGTSPTVAVGTVSTLAAGSSATVANSGTSSAAVFDFGIPQGPAGPYNIAASFQEDGYVAYLHGSSDSFTLAGQSTSGTGSPTVQIDTGSGYVAVSYPQAVAQGDVIKITASGVSGAYLVTLYE